MVFSGRFLIVFSSFQTFFFLKGQEKNGVSYFCFLIGLDWSLLVLVSNEVGSRS